MKGTLLTVQGALPLLVDGASVILMSSTTSALGGAAFSVYAASKAAVRNFARSWALDLKDRGDPRQRPRPRTDRDPRPASASSPTTSSRACSTRSPARCRSAASPTPPRSPPPRSSSRRDESSFVNGVELFADGGQAQV